MKNLKLNKLEMSEIRGGGMVPGGDRPPKPKECHGYTCVNPHPGFNEDFVNNYNIDAAHNGGAIIIDDCGYPDKK